MRRRAERRPGLPLSADPSPLDDNLLPAIWGRVTAEDAGEERLHEIAAILDEAARRIGPLK